MPSSTTLQHAIENITIWRKGEQRAPHKPLLLLYVLSQYQRGHARMFDYASEIRDELHSLLERFGPQRRQYRPDMPFWRLKGDGFWELHNSEQCSTQGSRQPPGKELFQAILFDLQTIDDDAAALRLYHAAEDFERRRFADAVAAQQAEEFARSDGKAQIAQNIAGLPAIAEADILDRND